MRNTRTTWLVPLTLFTAWAISSCQALKDGSWSEGKSWQALFHDQDRLGVPLKSFVAADGSYFPDFIQKFFPGSLPFSKDHPTLAQAQADVKMIEVKPLNQNAAKFNEANLSWSADGVYLGFEVLVNNHRKIMLKDLMGNYSKELQMIPKGPNNFLDGMVARSAQSYNAGLRWSRDSTRFAFMSNGGVGEYNIYVGAVGAPETPVTQSPTKDGYAAWSPNSNEIAFVSARTGRGDIYLVDLNDKQAKQISSGPEVDIFPEWFPDGNAIVYSSGDSLVHNLMIARRDAHGAAWQKPHPITQWQRDDLRPTVSPDGSLIAFYADDINERGEKRWNIHVIPDSKEHIYGERDLEKMIIARDVVIDVNTGPAWSPDSRKIFYVKRDPGIFNPIYAYDLFNGKTYKFDTGTKMNRDILMSPLGVLSFRAQVGVWDRVFVALTNQGLQLQRTKYLTSKIHYL